MKGILTALALTTALPIAASAADLDYSYVDAAYSQADSAVTAGKLSFAGGQGFLLDGSYGFGQHWFVEADYHSNSFHQYFTETVGKNTVAHNLTLTPQSQRLGGGFHAALADSVDFVAHLDYSFARTTVAMDPGASTREKGSGYAVGLGLRMHPTDAAEFDLGVDHDKLGFGGRLVAICATKPCGYSFRARPSTAESLLSAAARYNFGPVLGGVEYRVSNFQGWRELLVSLRIVF